MGHASLLAIRKSKFGRGLFAKANIAAGTLLCTVTGRLLTFQQTLELNENESYGLQIGPDSYILCEPPFLYSNHSCTPNCALNAQLQMFTLCDIKKDGELYWDYSTSMLERHWTMPCLCGATNCRKVITDFDLLPEQLQSYYINKEIVLPFILTQLQTFSKVHVHRA
jgi:SET domain-containing protein